MKRRISIGSHEGTSITIRTISFGVIVSLAVVAAIVSGFTLLRRRYIPFREEYPGRLIHSVPSPSGRYQYEEWVYSGGVLGGMFSEVYVKQTVGNQRKRLLCLRVEEFGEDLKIRWHSDSILNIGLKGHFRFSEYVTSLKFDNYEFVYVRLVWD